MLLISGIKLGQLVLVKSLEQKQYFEIKSKALIETFDFQKTKQIDEAFEAVTCSRMTINGSDYVEYQKNTGEVSLIQAGSKRTLIYASDQTSLKFSHKLRKSKFHIT